MDVRSCYTAEYVFVVYRIISPCEGSTTRDVVFIVIALILVSTLDPHPRVAILHPARTPQVLASPLSSCGTLLAHSPLDALAC